MSHVYVFMFSNAFSLYQSESWPWNTIQWFPVGKERNLVGGISNWWRVLRQNWNMWCVSLCYMFLPNDSLLNFFSQGGILKKSWDLFIALCLKMAPKLIGVSMWKQGITMDLIISRPNLLYYVSGFHKFNGSDLVR